MTFSLWVSEQARDGFVQTFLSNLKHKGEPREVHSLEFNTSENTAKLPDIGTGSAQRLNYVFAMQIIQRVTDIFMDTEFARG